MKHSWLVRILSGVSRSLRSIARSFRRWIQTASLAPLAPAIGKLVFAEKTFSITYPIHLVARIDRAYDDDGALILLELKTRMNYQVYESDIIELSAQRLAVQFGTGQPVRDQAYVEIHSTTSRRKAIHRVTLYPQDKVAEIANRRRQLLAGASSPRGPTNIALCNQCEYRDECIALDGLMPSRKCQHTSS